MLCTYIYIYTYVHIYIYIHIYICQAIIYIYMSSYIYIYVEVSKNGVPQNHPFKGISNHEPSILGTSISGNHHKDK